MAEFYNYEDTYWYPQDEYSFQHYSTDFNSKIYKVQHRDDYGYNSATYETFADPTMPSKGWYEGAGEGYEFKAEAGGGFEVEEEFGAKEWEYGEPEVDYQLEMQINNVMGLYKPYEEPAEALEGPNFALDIPFINYTYAESIQWSYQEPPTPPQLQPELMLYHTYSPPLPVQQPILHLPITQPSHPTYQHCPTGLHCPLGPTPRTQPGARRALHQSGQQQRTHPQTRRGTYLGSRDRNQVRGLRQEERGIDFHKAVLAIECVITFVWSLPHVMNNHWNTGC